jgi:hypothetical protein
MAISQSTKGAQTVATGTLTDSDSGAALAGRQVRFLVNGSPAASATTDGSGKATVSLKTKKGDVLSVVFDGDDYFVGSRAEKQR